MIFRIDTEEIQVGTLLDAPVHEVRRLAGEPNAAGRATLRLAALMRKPKDRSEIPVAREASFEALVVRELASGSIEMLRNGEPVRVVKPELRRIAAKLGLSIQNSEQQRQSAQHPPARALNHPRA
jgi:hypothetical protein